MGELVLSTAPTWTSLFSCANDNDASSAGGSSAIVVWWLGGAGDGATPVFFGDWLLGDLTEEPNLVAKSRIPRWELWVQGVWGSEPDE